MTKIDNKSHCGNSPKNQLLQDFIAAVARADRARIESILTMDACWQPVGRQPIAGRQACVKALTRYGPATKVVIEHIISHGKAGSVNGIVEFGVKRRGFCYVFEFSSAKGAGVRDITSYSVPLS